MTDAVERAALRDANISRQAEWDTASEKLSLTFKATELAGEVGEACNIVKKMERARLGLKGSHATAAQLAEELADVVICADLLALAAEIDLDAAVRDKFNATSEKYGLRTRLASPAADVIDADRVQEAMTYGEGFWRSCSGCHETIDGYPTGLYSNAFKCYVGCGCSECGGIGAIWDTTDYADMGDWLAKQEESPAAEKAPLYTRPQPAKEAVEALEKLKRILTDENANAARRVGGLSVWCLNLSALLDVALASLSQEQG